MAELKYVTKNDASPYSKPRIYFTGEAEGFSRYFDSVKTELFARHDCVIWYTDPEARQDEIEDYELRLKEMQLFVVPVTCRLLTEKNRTIDFDIPFAKKNHIPILPLMQEYGLTDLFTQIFGNLQYLDKSDSDPTAIPYEEKLTSFLNKMLVGDELSARIRASFKAYIFLSYRKKDRRYAQELMRLIHNSEAFRDIAIWYDEFLIPGEDFNDAIREALMKSDLVALTVTPNLVNENNYVLSTEYPLACRLGKAILPAEMVPTDRRKLKKLYKKIPNVVDSGDTAGLNTQLYAVLGRFSSKEPSCDLQHGYLIGLAYLSGIDVEIDHDRALRLITLTADAGYIPAIKKIISMYANGEGVDRDLEKAAAYQEKLVELLTEAYDSDPSEEGAIDLAQAESDLFHMFESLGEESFLRNAKRITNAFLRYQNLLDQYKNYRLYELTADFAVMVGKLFEKCKDYQSAIEYYRKASLLISMATLNGTVSVFYGDSVSDSKEANQAAFENVRISTDRRVVSLYLNIIRLYHKTGDLQKAFEYGDKAIKTAEETVKLTSSADDKRLLAAVYRRRSYTLKYLKNYDLSREYLEKAHRLYLEIAAETDGVKDRADAACCGYDMALLCELKGDKDGVMYELTETYAALRPLVRSGALGITEQKTFALTCGWIGDILFDHDRFDEAEGYYTEAHETVRKLSGKIDIGKMMINILTKLGDIHLEQGKYDSFEKEYFYACEFIKAEPENENNTEMQIKLADLRSKAGFIISDLGDHLKARLWLLEAKHGYRELNNDKEDSYFLYRLYLCSKAMAKGYMKAKDFDSAEKQYEDAVKYMQRLVQLHDDIDDKADLAEAYFSLADLYYEAKKFSERVACLEKARPLYKEVVDEKPSYRNMMLYALCLGQLADEYTHAFENSKAVDAAKEAAVVLEMIYRQSPDNDSAAFQLMRMYLIIGEITDDRVAFLRAIEISDSFPGNQLIAKVRNIIESKFELL